MVARGLRIVSSLDQVAWGKIIDTKMHGVSLLTPESQAAKTAREAYLKARSLAADKVADTLADTPFAGDETYVLGRTRLTMFPDLYSSIMRGLVLVDNDDPASRDAIVDQRMQAIEYVPIDPINSVG